MFRVDLEREKQTEAKPVFSRETPTKTKRKNRNSVSVDNPLQCRNNILYWLVIAHPRPLNRSKTTELKSAATYVKRVVG